MTDHISIGDMAGWMMAGMGFAGLAWLLICVVLLVLIIVGVVWLIDRPRADPRARGAAGGAARDELDLRYARGELEREAYLQLRRDLGGP